MGEGKVFAPSSRGSAEALDDAAGKVMTEPDEMRRMANVSLVRAVDLH